MRTTISATELVRHLGDILGRIRYRGESFIIVRNGTPVAELSPVPQSVPVTLREALAAWRAAGPPDPSFANVLEQVGSLDRPPGDAWGCSSAGPTSGISAPFPD